MHTQSLASQCYVESDQPTFKTKPNIAYFLTLINTYTLTVPWLCSSVCDELFLTEKVYQLCSHYEQYAWSNHDNIQTTIWTTKIVSFWLRIGNRLKVRVKLLNDTIPLMQVLETCFWFLSNLPLSVFKETMTVGSGFWTTIFVSLVSNIFLHEYMTRILKDFPF